MPERIGLQAVMDDASWKKGVQSYIKDVGKATTTTEQGAQQITKSTQGIGEAWGGMAKAVGGLLSVYMAKQIGQAVWDLGQLGATALQQKQAFQELAAGVGGSADEILAAIKRATDGTVAETDIILAANKGILLGLGAQADQWEDLTEVARYRSRAMGISVTQALDDITTGIGRESRMILDNLGIILDLDLVMGQYASSLGTTADALDATQRKQAIMTSVIKEGKEQIEAAGGIARNAADDFAELQATVEDLKTELAEGLAPALADAASGVTKFISETAIGFMLLGAAMEGTISIGDYFTIGMDAQRIASEEGAEAAREYVVRLLEVREGLEGVIPEQDGWMVSLGGTIPVLKDATTEAQNYVAALAGANVVISEMPETSPGQLAGMVRAAREYHQQIEERKAAEEQAAKDRVKAQEDALKKMQANEESYANALSQLYDQIVDTAEQAEQDRLQANEDYTRDALALEQDLARQRADIERDLGRELAGITRQLGQDRIDALTDLNRDLADLDADLTEDNEKTWKSYYATLESLAEAHGEKLKSITEKYAAQRASIEDKYRTTPTRDEEITSERERLQRELEALGRPRGFMERQQQAEILAALQALKDEELAIITAAQEEEIAAEETAYQEQQTQAAQRREEQLTANQEQIDKEAEQLQLGYERKLEDLRVAAEREREERNIAARQQLDDLRARGDEQRAELEAGHRARLAEIERGLAAETQGFRDAYNTQLSDLQTYLNQRTQQWRDHQREIENILGIASPSKWMQDIGKNMRLGLDAGFQGPSIATDLQQAVASFGQAANSLSLPTAAGGGVSNVSNTNYNDNLNFRATFTKPETERSVRDMLRLNQNMLRMRRGG